MTSKHRVVALLVGAGLVVSAAPGQGDGPFQFHSLTPCRLVDTRIAGTTVGNYGGILTSGVEKVTRSRVTAACRPGREAATLNVTAVNPTNTGRFTVYPSGIATPTVSTHRAR